MGIWVSALLSTLLATCLLGTTQSLRSPWSQWAKACLSGPGSWKPGQGEGATIYYLTFINLDLALGQVVQRHFLFCFRASLGGGYNYVHFTWRETRFREAVK